PVIFEAAADEAHAVRQQGGRERVARVARVGAAVEGEGERARAVERATGRQTEGLGCHEAAPGGAAIACVAVSRSTINYARQPSTGCQYSRCGPRGLSRK